MVDEIDVLESDEDINNMPCYSRAQKTQPIIIRGIGQLTMFGLTSRFNSDFPSTLTGKVAPEEFHETMQRINFVLQRTISAHFCWLLCGLLFCCCTFGCSLWPVICLSKRTIAALEKTIDHENLYLYNKLGMHLRLVKTPVDNSGNLMEYILFLETLPKIPLLMPD